MTRRTSCSAALVILLVGSVAVAGRSQAQQPPAPLAPREPALAALSAALPTLDDKARRGLALQVALDRAGFSPGAIDGKPGSNTDRALAAFEAARGTKDLGEAYLAPVTKYTITEDDAAGPFLPNVPDDMMARAKLPALSYTSIVELLGERFHATPELLRRLNPAAKFVAGEVISVPNVEPFVPPAAKPEKAANRTPSPPSGNATPERPSGPQTTEALTVVVTERTKTLQVLDESGAVVFHAPVTVGSVHDPLPVGEWKINGVQRNPVFHYNPKLFWDADSSHAKAKIPPGPNNPVGVVWIDLSKEHYGIHGTPEPARIGYSESHGCIRLTNWDAMRVAALVRPGTKVILR